MEILRTERKCKFKKSYYEIFYVTMECQTLEMKMKSHKLKIFTHVRPQETGVNIAYFG
jgi:hypothetical protein